MHQRVGVTPVQEALAPRSPTNHHLSQILERWMVGGAVLWRDWSIEAGVFAGAEPDGPYDLANFDGFGSSWSARIAKRWGGDLPSMPEWEASVSYADVSRDDAGATDRTRLWNGAVRYWTSGLYVLTEASRSWPEDDDGPFSVVGEAELVRGPHRPYARVEYATRPEFVRLGPAGTEDFFRYDHDADPIGGTRWFIASAGYGHEATGYPASVRPFIEVQYHYAAEERGRHPARAVVRDRQLLGDLARCADLLRWRSHAYGDVRSA